MRRDMDPDINSSITTYRRHRSWIERDPPFALLSTTIAAPFFAFASRLPLSLAFLLSRCCCTCATTLNSTFRIHSALEHCTSFEFDQISSSRARARSEAELNCLSWLL